MTELSEPTVLEGELKKRTKDGERFKLIPDMSRQLANIDYTPNVPMNDLKFILFVVVLE